VDSSHAVSRAGRRLLAVSPAAASLACLASLLAVFVSLFLPFATLTCIHCPDMLAGELYRGSLVGGLDGALLVALVATAAMVTVLNLISPWKRASAVASVALNLMILGMVSLDAVTSSTRVLHWSFSFFTVPMLGFYIAILGSVAAVFLSCVMLRQRKASVTPASPLAGGADLDQGAAIPQH
jgi:hypothetical protein